MELEVDRDPRRKSNIRLVLVLVSIVLVFFFGIMINQALVGP